MYKSIRDEIHEKKALYSEFNALCPDTIHIHPITLKHLCMELGLYRGDLISYLGMKIVKESPAAPDDIWIYRDVEQTTKSHSSPLASDSSDFKD